MDFLLGIVSGFVLGFGLIYIQYHKSFISSAVTSMRQDVLNLSNKVDKLVTSLSERHSS
jgi:hypothetical protein